MNDQESQEERIWAYLHGELDASGRKALEDQAKRDPNLAAAMESIRLTDIRLRSMLPLTEKPADRTDIEETILAHWEQEQQARTTNIQGRLAQDLRSHFGRQGVRKTIWQTPALRAAMAAAACFVILAGVRAQMWEPVTWSGMEVIPVTYRNIEPANGAPTASHDDLDRSAAALRRAVEEEFAASQSFTEKVLGTRKWILKGELRELPDGSLLVGVQARTARNGADAGAWSMEFTDANDWNHRLPALAREIVSDLNQVAEPGRQQP